MCVGEIQRCAGEVTVDWLLNIVSGQLDYLVRLPKNVLMRLILMLDLESIAHLSATCRLFREVITKLFENKNGSLNLFLNCTLHSGFDI